MGGIVRSNEPETEVVSLAEAKLFLRVDSDSSDDVLISSLIKLAREKCESITERSFIDTQWVLYLDSLSGSEIPLPVSKVILVEHFKYLDTNGDLQTWSVENYQVDTVKERSRIVLGYNKSWPAYHTGLINPVRITFSAGYGDEAADVPEGIKLAIKLLVNHWYENRNEVVTGTTVSEVPNMIQNLLWDFRVKER